MNFRVGEKYVQWVDDREPLSLDTILSMTSLYWFTDTFPRSIYPYRSLVLVEQGDEDAKSHFDSGSKDKPLGVSAFPREITILPEAWAGKLYPNLLLYKRHSIVRSPLPFRREICIIVL